MPFIEYRNYETCRNIRCGDFIVDGITLEEGIWFMLTVFGWGFVLFDRQEAKAPHLNFMWTNHDGGSLLSRITFSGFRLGMVRFFEHYDTDPAHRLRGSQANRA